MDVPHAADRAVARLAERVGMEITGLTVLSNRGNRIVKLEPWPIVARVTTLTAGTRMDPRSWLAREIKVAKTVFEAGGNVVPTCMQFDPGPYVVNGFAMSLWPCLHESTERPSAQTLGAALARFHEITAGLTIELPWLAPVTIQIPEALAIVQREKLLDSAIVAGLKTVLHQCLADIGGPNENDIVLHGDAHLGNVALWNGEWCWLDLEETCLGPPQWDLATLTQFNLPDGKAALRAYSDIRSTRQPTAQELAPFVRARKLEAAVWTACLAQHRPVRYLAMSNSLIDDLL